MAAVVSTRRRPPPASPKKADSKRLRLILKEQDRRDLRDTLLGEAELAQAYHEFLRPDTATYSKAELVETLINMASVGTPDIVALILETFDPTGQARASASTKKAREEEKKETPSKKPVTEEELDNLVFDSVKAAWQEEEAIRRAAWQTYLKPETKVVMEIVLRATRIKSPWEVENPKKEDILAQRSYLARHLERLDPTERKLFIGGRVLASTGLLTTVVAEGPELADMESSERVLLFTWLQSRWNLDLDESSSNVQNIKTCRQVSGLACQSGCVVVPPSVSRNYMNGFKYAGALVLIKKLGAVVRYVVGTIVSFTPSAESKEESKIPSSVVVRFKDPSVGTDPLEVAFSFPSVPCTLPLLQGRLRQHVYALPLSPDPSRRLLSILQEFWPDFLFSPSVFNTFKIYL